MSDNNLIVVKTNQTIKTSGKLLLTIMGNPIGKALKVTQIYRVGALNTISGINKTTGTKNEMNRIKELFRFQYPHHKPYTEPVLMKINIFYPIPKSNSDRMKKEKLEGRIIPTIKPDASNVIKLVEDALNKTAWRDDAQVIPIPWKYYSDNPRIELSIEKLEIVNKDKKL